MISWSLANCPNLSVQSSQLHLTDEESPVDVPENHRKLTTVLPPSELPGGSVPEQTPFRFGPNLRGARAVQESPGPLTSPAHSLWVTSNPCERQTQKQPHKFNLFLPKQVLLS